MNQWATSFHANRLLLDEVLAGIGEGGLTIAEALQRFGAADAVPGEEADEEAPKRLKSRVSLCPRAVCRRSRWSSGMLVAAGSGAYTRTPKLLAA